MIERKRQRAKPEFVTNTKFEALKLSVTALTRRLEKTGSDVVGNMRRVTGRVTALQNAIRRTEKGLRESLDRTNAKAEKRHKQLSERIAHVEASLKAVDRKNLRQRLLDIRSDSSMVHDFLQILILKQTVATELTRWAAGRSHEQGALIAYRIALAFDNSDEWWKEREGWTIDKWFNDLFAGAAPTPTPITDVIGDAEPDDEWDGETPETEETEA